MAIHQINHVNCVKRYFSSLPGCTGYEWFNWKDDFNKIRRITKHYFRCTIRITILGVWHVRLFYYGPESLQKCWIKGKQITALHKNAITVPANQIYHWYAAFHVQHQSRFLIIDTRRWNKRHSSYFCLHILDSTRCGCIVCRITFARICCILCLSCPHRSSYAIYSISWI